MSSRLSPVPRSHSRASVAASVTTYHSFQDVDVYEPCSDEFSSPAATTTATTTTVSPYVDPDPPTPPLSSRDEHEPASTRMRRQDSGYESLTPRKSQSRSRRRTSSNLSSSPPASRHRKRPSIRRSAQSGPAAHLPRPAAQAMYLTRPHQPQTQAQAQAHYHQHHTFFHFPAPEPATRASIDGDALVVTRAAMLGDLDYGYGYDDDECALDAPAHPAPPQTTHYWTSDRTRRLEYAAIDAASRGVRGWVMRHMVPDCFVPRERRRHITFDDDAGSVRRYRLDLDEGEESCAEKEEGGDCFDNTSTSGSGKERKVWWSIWKSK